MRVYIDVTHVIRVDFVTGIQRVVRNVVIELLREHFDKIVLLYGDTANDYYKIVNSELFMQHFSGEDTLENRLDMVGKTRLYPSEINAGIIFFDIDSVWLSESRSYLYPRLKANGVKIVTYVYDIIPIRFPQFCHNSTVFSFMSYIGACIQHSDYIITSSKGVLEDVHKLQEETGLALTPGNFAWLGSDFKKNTNKSEVDESVIKKLANKKYVLCVGTIEPRKNLSFILDAFDHGLFDKNISLVFAGRIGWNVEELVKRINSHSQKDRKFFYFYGLNDASIDYLYKNALVVALPTYDEGFGLPIVEAFEKGVPVVSSDRPVLREVGGNLADYFPVNDEKTFSDLILRYAEDETWRQERAENLRNYKKVTWKETAENIWKYISGLEPRKITVRNDIKQMVILTARAEAIGETLKYVDKYMPFINEVILCCPDKVKEEMRLCYSGRLHIMTLPDDEVLDGRKLPKDHQKRNTFLRACAILGDQLDEVFIMSDDDYRPLKTIDSEYYVSDGRYNAYYCYDIDEWTGNENKLTSYDEGMIRTAQFLKDKNLPTKQYSSHMPQVIDKMLYRELLSKYPEVMTEGFDEWSVYFNYLQKEYSDCIRPKIYQSLCWPGIQTHWDVMYISSEYVFENYYSESYEKDGVFEGLSGECLTDDYYAEKVRRYHADALRYKGYRDAYEVFCREYEVEYREKPSWGIEVENCELNLITPMYLVVPAGGFLRIPFFISSDESCADQFVELSYSIMNQNGERCIAIKPERIGMNLSRVHIPVYGVEYAGKYIIRLSVKYGERDVMKEIALKCV